jgi:hypothetical protein
MSEINQNQTENQTEKSIPIQIQKFNIKKQSNMTLMEQLLWNVMVICSEINEKLDKEQEDNSFEIARNPYKLLNCKFCGGQHENRGQVLACAKKHKGR